MRSVRESALRALDGSAEHEGDPNMMKATNIATRTPGTTVTPAPAKPGHHIRRHARVTRGPSSDYASRSKMLDCAMAPWRWVCPVEQLDCRVFAGGQNDVVERGVAPFRLHAAPCNVDKSEAAELSVVVLADVVGCSALFVVNKFQRVRVVQH